MRKPIRTAALTTVVLGVLGTFAAAAPGASRSTANATADRSAAEWCAAVIRINTKYGAMKNKRYLPQNQVPMRTRIAIFEAALAGRSKLLAITPPEIRKAQRDELTFFAHLKANHYATTTPLAPLTIAEIHQLAAFQRTKCGISGI
jgi:hypothetical protein